MSDRGRQTPRLLVGDYESSDLASQRAQFRELAELLPGATSQLQSGRVTVAFSQASEKRVLRALDAAVNALAATDAATAAR